jgi:hypothetical protein
MEVGRFSRWLQLLPLVFLVIGLAVVYDLTSYRGFSSPEAMDAAQVGRNLAEGRGYSTDFIRPFSLYLVSKHNRAAHFGEIQLTNSTDFARVNQTHPDLANAPVYPTVLAGLFKLLAPDWKMELHKPFWSANGKFLRYLPEFQITVLNQFLLIAVVALTFLIAKRLFDPVAAWLAAILTLGAEVLWRFSVSGQSTMLLLVIFLCLVWCLIKMEELGHAELLPSGNRLFILAFVAGLLTGIGMLTRYAFGWTIIPVVVFLVLFGGGRRGGLAITAFLAFVLTVTPWIIRNQTVSGTWFGTAGYAVMEGTFAFPGSRLMQSIDPDLTAAYWVRPYIRKLLDGIRAIMEGDLLRLGGGWVIVLFLAGLLLGLRRDVSRRLRYFTLLCLGTFVVVQALGKTQYSAYSPEINSENLLVLLTPLIVIFGVAFFITLLEQMKTPSREIRLGVVTLVVALCCQPLVSGLLSSKSSPVAYPPYYPPEIQRVSDWMRPDELMMSDIPWAIAWYGDRQCSWNTINSQYQFFLLNDNVKQVRGLYLTLLTLDGKLFTECLQGGVDSWGNFVLKTVAANQIPKQFPLKAAPYGLMSGLFLTDRQRWETQ